MRKPQKPVAGGKCGRGSSEHQRTSRKDEASLADCHDGGIRLLPLAGFSEQGLSTCSNARTEVVRCAGKELL